MITLKPLDADDLTSLIADPAKALARYPNREAVTELAVDVAAAILNLYGMTGAEAPWLSYFALDDTDNSLLGTCSFKSPPMHGLIEIAYFTFPGHEGQGVAGAMARALLKIAFAEAEVGAVLAHTLPEKNASVAILRRCGFTFIETVDDPDDGTIWRWALARDDYRPS
jgi:[ribosomal protein S5]-alanine N-acetyltransferase